MYRDLGMPTRSIRQTGERPGSGLPVLWNPESYATAPSLQRVESDAQRWGSLGLPHGPVHATHHKGINIFRQSHFKLKVVCGVVYITTTEVGNRVVSKLNVKSSNKLIDSDEEDNEEEIILQKPLIKRAFDSLKHLRLGKVSKVDSSSPVVKSFHRHLEIVCRLLSKFEEYGSSTAPVDQKSMNYSFILSFLCLLSRFNDLSSFFNAPSKFTEDLEKCEKAVSCCVKDVSTLMDACSTYLEDNRKSEPKMAVPIETAPARPLEGSGLIIPSCCAEVMTRAINRARAILGDLFDDQTPLDQTSSTSSLPSSSSTNLSSTQLENSDVVPSSSEPPQDPLYLPHPTSFSSVALSKSNELDSHFEEERSMVENRAGREMDAQNRARSHRPVKRGSSTSDDRKKVAAKIQKTPSRNQIAIDDSHSTPPTSLNRSLSSSGHPIATQIQAGNPISSESGDIPLTDENLQLLKVRRGSRVVYHIFFKQSTSVKQKTCLLCNQQVRSPEEHIRLHLTEAKQTLKQLLDYCCNTGRAPPIMNEYTIAKLIRKTLQKITVCPVCFVPIGEGGNYFGEHFRQEHLKVVERCDQLDTLVKKCFVNVSIESGVNKYSCIICGAAYESGSSHKVPTTLYDNIVSCLRRVPNSEKSPLVDLAAEYEWFLNESKDGKCPNCKNQIKDFGWWHFNKCRANYACRVEVKPGSIRKICPNCHIPFGCEDFMKAHIDSCDKLRDVNTRFCIEDYCDRLPQDWNQVKCSVAVNGIKCGETCWLNGLPSHLSEVHQIEGIKDEDWILCDGYCWCQWCGKGISRFQHEKLKKLAT